MGDVRKQHSAVFKSQVAIAAIRGDRTMSELSSEYGVHPTVINRWKKQALEAMPQIMSGKAAPGQREQEELVSRLYQEIGQLKVELDWLKKYLALSVEQKCLKIEPGHGAISIARQCSRSIGKSIRILRRRTQFFAQFAHFGKKTGFYLAIVPFRTLCNSMVPEVGTITVDNILILNSFN